MGGCCREGLVGEGLKGVGGGGAGGGEEGSGTIFQSDLQEVIIRRPLQR